MLDPRVNIKFKVWLIGCCDSLVVASPCGFQMLKQQVIAGRSEPCTLVSISPRSNHGSVPVMTRMRERIHPDGVQCWPALLARGARASCTMRRRSHIPQEKDSRKRKDDTVGEASDVHSL